MGLWVCNGGWMDVQHYQDVQRDSGVCNGVWMCNKTGVQWRMDVEQDSGCATEAARATGLWVCNGGWTCNGTPGVQCTLDV